MADIRSNFGQRSPFMGKKVVFHHGILISSQELELGVTFYGENRLKTQFRMRGVCSRRIERSPFMGRIYLLNSIVTA